MAFWVYLAFVQYTFPASVNSHRGVEEDSSCSTNIVSILNNDDHPSFAVRSNPRHTSSQPSPSLNSQPEQLPPLAGEAQYNHHSHASSASPTASPRSTRHTIMEPIQPTSPGSSDGSAYEYLTSHAPSSAYHPYARQDSRRDAYRFPSRGPVAPRTPPEIQSTSGAEAKSSSSGGTRGTGPKNKYPCPYAASHGCSATFTTSGHAARHGKKHTGEKSVHCPICNKAFTRKDNMKQHIRTHRTHSDEMRSTSEPEADPRWAAVSRPESGYTSAHNRTVSQSTDASNASVMPPPGARLNQHQS
ncbi:C2H2 transcription factor (Egr2) [Penicillium waksmanii]|uniref:C2H2 transcription factor (Egr2) n=1 Tax=Penicillium waksmanii TaxID=69791 RepID=UPI002546C64F|nr:C2H2 transcription factor (Egr2) [Penicillium waksmanii]KAJ5995418.1 C2H2 transcription factor (Egr2) [Penicillium waksmanii]